ncbi:MAG: hypothetical protein DRI61_06575 [Chloroflexi bacterium]|nr:MAG: hypothetical protein DRI61_06575 [Chloroflexota bacterium]
MKAYEVWAETCNLEILVVYCGAKSKAAAKRLVESKWWPCDVFKINQPPIRGKEIDVMVIDDTSLPVER